ncbi:unnamed protein product, partial [Arabidopsis halleri]
GDKARLLANCNQWFHADCLDKWLQSKFVSWLQSNSTCPICVEREFV